MAPTCQRRGGRKAAGGVGLRVSATGAEGLFHEAGRFGLPAPTEVWIHHVLDRVVERSVR